jgi:hypothetical protein
VNTPQDDDALLNALLNALGAAVADRDAVPAAFAETARSAYAWHGVDAELAQLTYDSRHDTELNAALRSESASIRAVSFQSSRFSIEVEITDDALFGQLVPPFAGTAELQTLSGHQPATADIDLTGRFTFQPRPDSPFRLLFHTRQQPDVAIGWLTPLSPGRHPPVVSRRGR